MRGGLARQVFCGRWEGGVLWDRYGVTGPAVESGATMSDEAGGEGLETPRSLLPTY